MAKHPYVQGGRAFPQEEFDRRRQRVREVLAEQRLDACLIAAPENIYYLTGLSHQGYFAYTMLVLPREGKPILITRAMEHAIVRDQAPDVVHIGYGDGDGGDDEPPAVTDTLTGLKEAGLSEGRLGIEKTTNFFPFAVAEGVVRGLPKAEWIDASDLVNNIRIVQSPLEIELTREAAKVSDAMMLSAIAAAGEGAYQRDVMASIYDALFRRDGTFPGFIPLVRATKTIDHEHGTWHEGRLEAGEVLFVELAGCRWRYHAPMGRLIFIGKAPDGSREANALCQEAMGRTVETIRPGIKAREVYASWQKRVDEAGLDYKRHHCGYAVGIGFPPSWSGSGVPVGLRRDSDLELRSGMVFHLMSWLLKSSLGDAFLSDTIVVTDDGCERLTSASRDLHVR